MRVAVVFKDRCQPKRCHLECIAFCPPQRTGTEVIWIDPETTKAAISEETCISCGICLPAGAPISTDSGIVDIDRMTVGTRVLTHAGRYRAVTGVQTRIYDGTLFRIRVTGQPDSLEVTEEHPILAVRRRSIKGGRRLEKGVGVMRWVRPTELKVGDYLVKARSRDVGTNDSWDVDIPMVLGGGRHPQWSEQLISVPLTPDLARLVGYYLSEGSADDRRLVFSFHEKEQNYRNDVRHIVHQVFGLQGYETKNSGLGRNVRYDSAVLARVFGSLGRRCDQKRIPATFRSAPRAVREELVRGFWRGDGHWGYHRNYFGIVTTSRHLAYQLQEILGSLGIAAGVTARSPPGKRRVYRLTVTAEFSTQLSRILQVRFSDSRNRKASHYLVDQEFVYSPIRSIESRRVEGLQVFNLEVEEDQTYTAAGEIVHNCVRKCPFDAIRIIGLPEALKEDLVHQYGKNAFRLFRIPVPKKGEVIGLLGPNGIGKTTAVGILSGETAPNLGHYRRKKPHWDDVLEYFKGTEVHGYLEKIAHKGLTTAIKPQYVDKLSKVYSGKVRDLLRKIDHQGKLAELITSLELGSFLDRDIGQLSGGELQRLAIAATMLKDADVYFFDEPSSYLDIYQRLKVAKVIQSLSKEKYVVVVEHDLAVLDFLADTVFLMYGEEGAYGIIAQPRPVRTAINVYLGGYLKEENIRFREREIRFDVRPPRADWKAETLVAFDELTKRYEGFELVVHPGRLRKGEVVGVVGPNATGKTTFVKMLAGEEAPTSGAVQGKWQVSYKPQYLEAVYEGTVGDLLRSAVGKKADSGYFETEILQPLKVKGMMERDVSTLSGGELQRVAIALCLGRDADIYLLDEPSAYLDSNQRMEAARTIRRVMEREARTGLIVDHDVYFLDMVSDSLMVFSGDPGRRGVGEGPFPMREGMNRFLKMVGITFRRDADTNRPRINKLDSRLDREQKSAGEYYYATEETLEAS